MNNAVHKTRFYLININDEFQEGDEIIFEMPSFCSGDYLAKVYKDEKGLFIRKKHNYFEGCRDYDVKHGTPEEVPQACLDEVALKTKPMSVMGRAKSIEPVEIPNGKYPAVWSGYTIKVLLPDWTESDDIKVDQGVRGINCKSTVEVIDGWLYAE